MKVLVTGGAGFIGGHVVDRLRSMGHDPVVFDRRRDRGESVFLGDILDPVAVCEAMGHVDGFIHLAGVLGTQETVKNPRPAVETNILGGLNILEAAAQYQLPGVNIGVGNHWMQNPYSISKSTMERFAAMYNAERGTRINTVRAMNAYGPRQHAAAPYGSSRVRKITPSFICRALHNDPIEVYGAGDQVSDMVYVTDVAKALVRALECANRGIVFDQVVEVGPSVHNTVMDVALMVKELTGSKSEIVCLPMRPGEVPNAVVAADTSTLELVGMTSSTLVPLREGLKRTIDYFARNFGIEHHSADRRDDESKFGILADALSGAKVGQNRDQPAM